MEDPEGFPPAIVFLIAYVCYTVAVYLAILTKKCSTSNAVSLLLVHGVIRVATQTCLVVGAAIGLEGERGLLGVITCFNVQSYFILLVASVYFMALAEQSRFGHSRFLPTRGRWPWCSIGSMITVNLLVGDIVAVVGESIQASSLPINSFHTDSRHPKDVRMSGYCILVAMTACIAAYSLWTIVKDRLRTYAASAVLASTLCLLVRGIYNISAVHAHSLNYHQFYSMSGVFSYFLACENVLGTLMEFAAAVLLFLTFFVKTPQPVAHDNVENEDRRIDSVELGDVKR